MDVCHLTSGNSNLLNESSPPPFPLERPIPPPGQSMGSRTFHGGGPARKAVSQKEQTCLYQNS